MEDPIISFKGRNGKIELYKDFVRFDRGTLMGFLMQGLKGKKDIYFHSITSIQIKKPGFTAGYIQFSIPGGNESKKGVFDSLSDENTISFFGDKNYEKTLQIKEYIEQKIKTKDSIHLSSAEEIKKLHSLFKDGVLTQEEFESMKRKVLDK
jgi:hypothetical protein